GNELSAAAGQHRDRRVSGSQGERGILELHVGSRDGGAGVDGKRSAELHPLDGNGQGAASGILQRPAIDDEPVGGAAADAEYIGRGDAEGPLLENKVAVIVGVASTEVLFA